MPTKLHATLRLTVGALVLMSMTYFTVTLVQASDKHKQLSLDLAEIQHIKHGLLDANRWARELGLVLTNYLNQLTNSADGKKKLRPVVEEIVDAGFDALEEKMTSELPTLDLTRSKPVKELLKLDFTGKLRERVRAAEQKANASMRTLIADSVSQMKKLSPTLTDLLIDRFTSQNGAVRRAIETQIQKFMQDTQMAGKDTSALRSAMQRNHCRDGTSAACEEKLSDLLNAHREELAHLPALILLFFFALLAWCLWSPCVGQVDIVMLLVGTLLLLIGGILNPMMSIEAKINELSFGLFDQTISFQNQVIFFQSKSIFDVVFLMVSEGTIDTLIVGILIATFSIAFPCAKLVASLCFCYDLFYLRQRRIIQFFALKSGKWSMADVFVIAIFMAFIGFTTLIDAQVGQMTSGPGSALTVVPKPNGTSLGPGLYLFTGFCIASLLVGGLIEKIVANLR